MRRYITLAAVLLACAAASAQNLNPTVQVTNDYEGKLMEVEKQKVGMAVPDSLLKFDWNFNYSVFDNPYKGAYEFSPYRIEMKPEATVRDNGRFYLRAGAGYSLHPEGQVVFTPDIKGRFGLSLYDDFKGYFGNYHTLSVVPDGGGSASSAIGRDGDYSGNEISNRAGTTLRFDAPRTVFTLDAGMDLLRTKEAVFEGNEMLGGSAALRARSVGESDFLYDASVSWRGLGNKVLPPKISSANATAYREHDAGLEARFIYRLADRHSIRFEPSYRHIIFTEDTGAFTGTAIADVVDIVPSYVFSDAGFSFQAGIRFSGVWRDSKAEGEYNVADYDGRKIFPDLRVYYEAVPDKLVLTAKVTGGQRFNTYRSYLMDNHHLSMLASSSYPYRIGDATVNALDAGIGISGRVRSIFQFDAQAGFTRSLNAPMDAVFILPDSYDGHSSAGILPVITMADYKLIYADLNGTLVCDRLDASANLRVQKSMFEEGMDNGAFTLPLFTGSAELVYNWNKRVFAGLSAFWATGREGSFTRLNPDTVVKCHVPGWVDLGVNAKFRVNNHFSLWAEGRNLLNQTVMRNFLISEKGPYFTAGVCLNF